MPHSQQQSDRQKHPGRKEIATLQRSLLTWYDQHRRRLPWRSDPGKKPNPYHVLISEAMLQQTQVATVISYFQRFVQQWPTLQALGDADEQQVLRLWQGLGYYRRARNLHAAVRQVLRQHDGQLPETTSQLRTLPGVGPYTAGAIASIAFNQRAAILDGNVARVLARWQTIDQPVTDPATRKRLWSLALAYVPAKRPGDFNQAMMDLGATICLPRSPVCDRCPVTKGCQANQSGLTEKLPVVVARKPPRRVTHHVLAIEKKGSFLFQQRPNQGLWSAMWQMPTIEMDDSRQLDVEQLQDWATKELNLAITAPSRNSGFHHQTTHRTIGFVIWTSSLKSGRLRRGTGQWQRLTQVDKLPLANPQRRIVALLANR